jgi:hypothetical protein
MFVASSGTMKRVLRRLLASLLRDDLLLRVACFLGGALFGGLGVTMFIAFAQDLRTSFSWVDVVYWLIAILLTAWGALLLSRCVLPAQSRIARLVQRILPDAAGFEEAGLLILLIYLPAMLLTLLLRLVGVRGQRIDWDREFS